MSSANSGSLTVPGPPGKPVPRPGIRWCSARCGVLVAGGFIAIPAGPSGIPRHATCARWGSP